MTSADLAPKCALSKVGLLCWGPAVRRLTGEKLADPVELCFNHATMVVSMRLAMGWHTEAVTIHIPD